jgi:hypothetical protein
LDEVNPMLGSHGNKERQEKCVRISCFLGGHIFLVKDIM